jgi:hypothetical protein
MTPKDKKQYGNMGGNYGPYGPPIYQQPQLPHLPYSNGYGMNSFANQINYPAYYPTNIGDGDPNMQQQQQQQQQQQLDPPSYSYSNGLAYYPSQGPDVEATTLPVQTSSAVSVEKSGAKKKQGWHLVYGFQTLFFSL